MSQTDHKPIKWARGRNHQTDHFSGSLREVIGLPANPCSIRVCCRSRHDRLVIGLRPQPPNRSNRSKHGEVIGLPIKCARGREKSAAGSRQQISPADRLALVREARREYDFAGWTDPEDIRELVYAAARKRGLPMCPGLADEIVRVVRSRPPAMR